MTNTNEQFKQNSGERKSEDINISVLIDNFEKEKKIEDFDFAKLYKATPESQKVFIEYGRDIVGSYNSIWRYIHSLRYAQDHGKKLNQEQVENALEGLEIFKKIDDELTTAKTQEIPPNVQEIDRLMAEFIAKRFDQRVDTRKRDEDKMNTGNSNVDIDTISLMQDQIHSLLEKGQFLSNQEIQQSYPNYINKHYSPESDPKAYPFREYPAGFVRDRFTSVFGENL